MKKQAIAFVIVGIFAISLASASLFPFLSNVVTGTVDVSGPIFYANIDNELTFSEPESYTDIITFDSDGKQTWDNRFSKALEFYDMDIKMTVEARAYITDDTIMLTPDTDLSIPAILKFGYFDGIRQKILCEEEILINSDDEFNTYDIECSNVNGNKEMNGFYYIVDSASYGAEYEIQLSNANTRVEIRGADD